MSHDPIYVNFLQEDFVHACRDYYYLINRHFPERGVLKLVGDRYRLSGDQRTMLYRGISARKRSLLRESLLVNDLHAKEVIIDGYNVLFTLLNYRTGKITFISTDGFLRDAGALHGKLRNEKIFMECISLLVDYLVHASAGRVDIYLDSPVSHSEKHALWIRKQMESVQLKGDCLVIKSADWALRHSLNGILATSDTAIIEKALLPVADLPRGILEANYRAVFLRLSELLGPDKAQDPIDEG